MIATCKQFNALPGFHSNLSTKICTSLVATEGISPDKSTWWKQLDPQDLTSPTLSKADEAWMDEGLEFVYSREGVSIPELNDLFQKVTMLHSSTQKVM